MATAQEDKLILLGNGPSKDQCPFTSGVETWAAVSLLSDPNYADKHYDKVFCFDNPALKSDEQDGLVIAKERNIAVVGHKRYVSAATEEYPLVTIMKEFHTNYFLNDMSYMIALAVHKAYKSLFLYGVDQTGSIDMGRKDRDGEFFNYAGGRAYVAFWLGVATGRGTRYMITSTAEPWMRSSKIGGY